MPTYLCIEELIVIDSTDSTKIYILYTFLFLNTKITKISIIELLLLFIYKKYFYQALFCNKLINEIPFEKNQFCDCLINFSAITKFDIKIPRVHLMI